MERGSSSLLAGCGSGGGSDGDSASSDASDLSRSRWEELPSTDFSVTHERYGAVDMKLTAIDDEFNGDRAEQFSVVLTGPTDPTLKEGTYQVYNDSLGYIELFLQPGKRANGQQDYRAIFSLV